MFSWCQSHLKYRYFGSPKHQESSKAAMQHSEGGERGKGEPSQAGAKPAAKLDIKKSSRARGILSNFLSSPGLQGNTKAAMQHSESPIKQLSSQQQGWRKEGETPPAKLVPSQQLS